jgi:peptidoglycan/LPS O-acetylase OafA/YrhL
MIKNTQETDISHPISYRPDIDGLRALAVVAVVLFHAFPSTVHGGYVGVDIFFVISGFLISSILLKNIKQKKFSVLDFYYRRIKRIFPALMLVLTTTLCIGWTIMLSDEFKLLGQHTVAATLFASNFWLWKEAGYFDTSSDLKPLLHLWSLAIEEQFYIIWPLLLLFLSRFTRHIAICIFLITLLSFFSCITYMADHTGMFYFPHNRAWELLAGAFLAALQFKNQSTSEKKISSRSVFSCNALSWLGLLLIMLAIGILNKNSIFPGWLALLPVLGATMIIAAGESAWINQYVLSTRIFVFIGLISYPLYLWHWPLLAFSRIMENGEPSTTIRGLCLAISAILSLATYRLLELPLRTGGKRTVTSLLIIAILIGSIGYLCCKEVIKSRANFYNLETIMNACEDWGYPKDNITPVKYNGLAFNSQGENKKTTIFIGDSNMEQYLPRINKILTDNPTSYNRVIFATQGGCAPVLHIKNEGKPPGECGAFVNSAYELALNNQDIDTVVIAALWDTYFGAAPSPGRAYDENGTLYPLKGTGSDGEIKSFLQLEKMINELLHAGKRVFLILNIPRGGDFDPRGLIKRSWGNMGFGLTHPYDGIDINIATSQLKSVTSGLKEVAQRTGISVFDPVELVCLENKCPILTKNGLPIYKDNNHFNATFVKNNLSFLDQTVIPR